MEVVVYTTPTCPYCRQAKEFLRQKGIPFVEKDVTSNPAHAQEMIQVSGQRGVPVLIINGQVIVGFNRPLIEQVLSSAGPTGAGRPRLGASVADAAKVAAKYGLGVYQGAYVGQVTPGSPAERAGIRVGDVILGMAGYSIQNADDVQHLVERMTPGQSVPVVVWRDGRQIQLEVRF